MLRALLLVTLSLLLSNCASQRSTTTLDDVRFCVLDSTSQGQCTTVSTGTKMVIPQPDMHGYVCVSPDHWKIVHDYIDGLVAKDLSCANK